MRNVITTVLTSAALVALVGIASGAPSYASTTTALQSQDPAPFAGELIRVSPDTKLIVVKSPAGKEMEFTYSDQTVVTGAQKNAAGLASSSGSEVTVSYRVEAKANIATRIDVRGKEAPQK
jgi:hypothetical protein